MDEILGNRFTLDCSFDLCIIGVGTNKMKNNKEFNIFHNPNTGLFNINSVENVSIIIYNTTGLPKNIPPFYNFLR
jgi:hypothetical protein